MGLHLPHHGDRPGENVTVRPAAAPRWLRPALGVDSHQIEATMGQRLDRNFPPVKKLRREAAVLVLLAGDCLDNARVLLTHRAPTMRSHSGQIAFPGGRVDPEDSNLVDAALREAWEETGLDRRSVTPIDQWERLRIRATGNPVTPVLAYWHSLSPVGVASPAETDDVFTVPLTDLIDPANRIQVGWGAWSGPAFRIQGYVIWGFTAGVLATTLRHAGWEQPWDNNSVRPLRATLAASRNREKMNEPHQHQPAAE